MSKTPVRDEDIHGPGQGARNQAKSLLGGAKGGGLSSSKDDVSYCAVAITSIPHLVFPKGICWAMTFRAGVGVFVERDP